MPFPLFLNQDFELTSDRISPDHGLWQQVNEQLNLIRDKNIHPTKDGQLICFDSWTLHRVVSARIRGWRLFFRMAMWHKQNIGESGMLTKQEQVYKHIDHYGW